MRIQLLHVPDCPMVNQLRTRLHRCLHQAGISMMVEETEGPYPSPTLLIDGVDVATGDPPPSGACCRLDLPTDTQILSALQDSTP